MNVQELLEETDLLIPNSFSLAQKIRWMNQTQRQMYRHFPGLFTTNPPDLREDNLTDVPLFLEDYHELFVYGAAKRMAERIQKFDVAGELEMRYQALFREATEKAGPKLTAVQQTRVWI